MEILLARGQTPETGATQPWIHGKIGLDEVWTGAFLESLHITAAHLIVDGINLFDNFEISLHEAMAPCDADSVNLQLGVV